MFDDKYSLDLITGDVVLTLDDLKKLYLEEIDTIIAEKQKEIDELEDYDFDEDEEGYIEGYYDYAGHGNITLYKDIRKFFEKLNDDRIISIYDRITLEEYDIDVAAGRDYFTCKDDYRIFNYIVYTLNDPIDNIDFDK
jgi:hypothetical protein